MEAKTGELAATQAAQALQAAKPPQTDAVRCNFADVLSGLNGGVDYEAAAELEKLARAVAKERRKGTLSLILTLEPVESVKGAVQIKHDVKVKAPMPERESSVRFIGRNGELLRDDPRQGTFDEVEASFKRSSAQK